MAVSTLAASLLDQEIFQGLSPLQITEIVRRAEKVVFSPGQTLIEHGEIGDAAILIVSGDAVRTEGQSLDEGVEQLEPGSLIGEMTMFIDREHTSTVIAHTPVKALRVTRADLLAQMYEDPTLAEHLAGKISSRLDGLIRQLQSIEVMLKDGDRSEPSPLSAIAPLTIQPETSTLHH